MIKNILLLSAFVFATVLYYSFILNRGGIGKDDLKNPLDYLQYSTGASIIESGEINKIYTYETQTRHQKALVQPYDITGLLAFRTPPTTALVFLLLNKLGVISGYRVFLVVNVMCTILIVVLLKALTGISFRVLALLTAYNLCYFNALMQGQVTILVLLFLLASIFFVSKDRDFTGGLIAGLAFLKPNLLIALPFIMPTNKSSFIKYSLGSLTTIFGFMAVNLVIYGTAFVADYLKFALLSESPAYGTPAGSNLNVTTVIEYITRSNPIVTLLTVVLYLVSVAILLKETKKLGYLFRSVIGLTFSIILNLHTMMSDLAILLIPSFILLSLKRVEYKFIGLIIYLTPILRYINKETLTPTGIHTEPIIVLVISTMTIYSICLKLSENAKEKI